MAKLDQPNMQTAQLFCAQKQLQGLKQDLSLNKISYAELIQYVKGRQLTKTSQIAEQINQDLNLYRQYKNVLTQLRSQFSGQQAAAASESDEITVRQGQGFSIKFKDMPNHHQQKLLLLTIDSPSAMHSQPNIVLHIELNNQFYRVVFPSLIDGQTQLAIDQTSSEWAALSHLDSELSLI